VEAAQREVRRIRRRAEAHGGPVARDPHSEEGEALEPVVSAMALWGYGRIPREDDEDRRASWVASSMRAAMAPEGGAAADGRYAFEGEDERVAAYELTAELTDDPERLAALLAGFPLPRAAAQPAR
jgi:hypothetical protein